MLSQPRLVAAALFHVLYAGGLAFFAVLPNVNSGHIWSAAGCGAALGLVAYGTYDVTHYATPKGFAVSIMLVTGFGAQLSAQRLPQGVDT
jgi:uncharacterized membrane protein